MEKVEIFTGHEGKGVGLIELQEAVNHWLSENIQVKIVDRKMSAEGCHCTIAIFYIPLYPARKFRPTKR